VIELAAAYQHCRRVTHRYGPNFSLGFRLLPPPKRDAVYAAYAFCRFADDIVDQPAAQPQRRIADWEAELERCYRGAASHPITVALADAAARYDIPAQPYRDLIRGCQMDLERSRYQSFEELMRYCELVAHTIATISLRIFGTLSAAAAPLGRDLASALQLTNIARDIGEDCERGRIYLPLEELERFAVSEQALLARRPERGFAGLLQFQIERARSYFRRAAALPQHLEPDARPCVTCMASTYRLLLDRIERGGRAVLKRRIRLGRWAKLRLAWAARGIRPRFTEPRHEP